jgi:Rnl2 family RNA ligase
MDNRFQKYGSIENRSTKKFLNDVLSYFPDVTKQRFVVLEKAHGAHFSFQTDGVNITCAKRSSIIADNENFFDHLKLLEENRKRIGRLCGLMMAKYPNAVTVQIEGELIGGDYPHPAVTQLRLSRVQKGVFYCPDYRFFAYDIRYFDKVDDSWKFVNYDICMEMFKECDFWYAEPLMDGMFNDVIKYDPVFQTLIPRLFGLPEIDKNFAEGVVIKPVEPLHFPNGSRVIFKNKNDAFSETLTKKEGKPIIDVKDMPLELQEISEDMMLMITSNRLDNVISKIGAVTKKDEGRLIGLLSKDVLEEFEKIHEERWGSFVKNDQKLVTKKLAIQCKLLVSDYFINKI